MISKRIAVYLVCAALAVAAALPLLAQSQDEQGPEVEVTVTVVRRNASAPQALTKEDILVYQDHDRRPVVSWTPAWSSNRSTDLAVLVDDSAGTSFDNQLPDLKRFVSALPSSVQVAVAYARNGNATMLQNFTADHALAAKAFRLPVGRPAEGSSIYMALSDMVKRFPNDHDLHEVLLISDGIDLYRGVMDSVPGANPDLGVAIQKAQHAGVTVFSIFANSAGLARQNRFLIHNGQGCLALLTLETGGQAFFQGFETPISFQPFLSQIEELLRNQYALTFRAKPLRKAGTAPIRVTTEQPEIELLAPRNVYIPAS